MTENSARSARANEDDSTEASSRDTRRQFIRSAALGTGITAGWVAAAQWRAAFHGQAAKGGGSLVSDLGLLDQRTASAAEAQTNKEPIAPGWVDAHAHIWGRDLAAFPLAAGQTLADLDPPSFTPEELLSIAQPLGVSRVVLIQHHIYHGWDNSYLLHAAKTYPDHFRVIGMVDDLSTDPGDQMRKLQPQGVTGFRITSLIRGADQWLTGDGMQSMWQTAARTGQAMCCLINPADLPAVAAQCQKFPDTPVVIDHFARIGMTGEIVDSELDALCGLAKHPRVFVKLSAYYALGRKRPPHDELQPMIRRLIDVYGVERLMWASDAPYQLTAPNSYAASLKVITEGLADLSAGEREWLLRKTAEQVLFS